MASTGGADATIGAGGGGGGAPVAAAGGAEGAVRRVPLKTMNDDPDSGDSSAHS